MPVKGNTLYSVDNFPIYVCSIRLKHMIVNVLQILKIIRFICVLTLMQTLSSALL
jgi:hypothetical protein